MSTIRWLLVALVAFISAAAANADTQDYLISKGGDQFNSNPGIAIHSRTNDLIVVWKTSSSSNAEQSKILAVRLSFRKGKLKVKKPRTISESGDLSNYPDVAFDPQSDRFLVVWETKRKNNGNVTRDVVGRFLNAKGKPKGKQFNIAASAARSEKLPRIAGLPDWQTFAPAARYFVVWNQTDFSGDLTSSGIYGVFLMSDGKRQAVPKFVFPAKVDPDRSLVADLIPADLVGTSSGEFYLSCIKHKFAGGGFAQNKTVVYVMNISVSGTRKSLFQLDDGTDYAYVARVAVMADGSLLVAWESPKDRYVYDRRFSAALKALGKQFPPASGVISTDFVYVSDKLYQMVNAFSGKYAVQLSKTGKITGDPINLGFDQMSEDVEAVLLPGTKYILIITRFINDYTKPDQVELRGYVVEM